MFDAGGKYLTEWDHVGALSSLIMTPDQKIWAGGVLRDLDGKALERLPGEGPMPARMAARSPPMAMSILAC